MGLDMYLTKRTYIGNKHRKQMGEEILTIKLPKDKPGKTWPISGKINEEKISEIVEEAGYWRKANAIHKWFVNNVQDGNDDCGEYHVSEEKLKKLLNICKIIKENPKMAHKLLPTTDGFFFGSTDYDNDYYEDIANTIPILEEAIKNPADYYYHSSW